MTPKNTICLWFDKDAHDAARFYAATFPDSKVTAVRTAPGDYPSGKAGDVLTVEFTVLGIPCIGLNGGPDVQAQRGVLLPGRDRQPGRDRPLLERDRRQRRPGEPVRLVQGSLGPVLADHPARADRRDGRGWRRGEARLRRDDDDEEDRRRHHRGRAAGLTPEAVHMTVDPRAGQPVPDSLLVDVDALRQEYYARTPDLTIRTARQVRHQRSSRIVASCDLRRGARPGDHAGDLRLPAHPWRHRPALPR